MKYYLKSFQKIVSYGYKYYDMECIDICWSSNDDAFMFEPYGVIIILLIYLKLPREHNFFWLCFFPPDNKDHMGYMIFKHKSEKMLKIHSEVPEILQC